MGGMTTKKGIKLKGCPFCGSDPEIRRTSDEYEHVKCTNCFAVMTDSYLIGTNEAVKKWNKRVDS